MLLVTPFSFCSGLKIDPSQSRHKGSEKIYDISVKDNHNRLISMREFQNRVLLIVNVASKCGYTTETYSKLSQLHEKYHEAGLNILAFPCNQFGGQEPGTSRDIELFARKEMGAQFRIFSKIDVNGESASPLFSYLKDNAPGDTKGDITWNFTSFLVDGLGNVIQRWGEGTDLTDEGVIDTIENALTDMSSWRSDRDTF
eukprot:UC4_evm3s639